MAGTISAGGKNFFDGHKIGLVQKRFLILSAWAYAFDQMDIMNFGMIAPTLMKQYGWTMQQIANVNSYNMFGMLFGALFGGWLADKIGRKKGILFCIGLFSVASLLNALSPNYLLFAVMRTLTGFGSIGMVTIAMVYISEMMPSESRGKFQALTIACGTIGVPLCAIFARIMIPISGHGWRFVFILGGLGVIILLVGSSWFKESPRWLVSKGRIDEAEKVLNEIVPGNKLPDNAVELAKMKNSGYIDAVKVIFSPQYLKRSIVLFIVTFGVTLGSFYLLAFYTVAHAQMGFAQTVILNLSIAQYFCWPIADAGVGLVSDRGGRKIPIIVWFTIVGGLFIFQGTLSSVVAITAILLIRGCFQSGCMTLIWTYLAESYPTHIRSSATGILFGSCRFLTGFMLFTVPLIFQNYGYFGVNFVNGLFYIIPAVLILLFGDKTANVSLESLNPSVNERIN